MGRSIPAPTNTDFSIALKSSVIQARSIGVDVNNSEVLTMLVQQSEVRAQMSAEIRFLRNITHPK